MFLAVQIVDDFHVPTMQYLDLILIHPGCSITTPTTKRFPSLPDFMDHLDSFWSLNPNLRSINNNYILFISIINR